MMSLELLSSQESTTSSVFVLEVHLEQVLDVDLCDIVDDVPGGNCQGVITASATLCNITMQQMVLLLINQSINQSINK